jgi:uncharacterized protein with GYD domain
METYIVLGNFTKQGVDNLKGTPERIEAVRKAVEEAGGKWLGWYLTLGQYDFMVITQSPDSNQVASLLMATGMQGNVRTETLRAFTEAEFKNLVQNLP